MTNQTYASFVFAERFNSYFGEKALHFSLPKVLTDSIAQRDTLVQWALEKDYANKISTAIEEFKAATTLDHRINGYFNRLVDAIEGYKTFIANLESGSGYDFSKVTWWPYSGAEQMIEKYRAR